MIGGSPFYNSLFKKYVVIFGTLFNNIMIERVSDSGVLEQTFKIPIAYGPREKFLARVEENPDASAVTAIRLPRMSFEISGVNYDPSRKLQTVGKIGSKRELNGKNTYKKVFNPVPYNLGFKLDIMVKTMEDGLRIVEQILPYFTPEWTVSARLLPDYDNVTDIPLIMDGMDISDSYESDFMARRALIFTLNFTMKCYFYGPVTESKLIKISDVKIYPNITANSDVADINVRPGLTANGMPTSDPSLSIPLSQIEETDTYGFIVTVSETYG